MERADFEKQLLAIFQEANDKTVELVRELRDSNADGMGGTQPVDFVNSGGNWERTADYFADLTGFIHDCMNGRNRNERKSMTQKLRKALGYNVR